VHLVEETDNRFCIKESSILNAGYGLFANQDLKKDDHLEIIGIRVKKGSIADQCTHYANKYKFAAQGKITKGIKEIDPNSDLIVPLGYGGIVNHAPNPELQNAEIWYNRGSKRNQSAGQAVYRFIRDISEGEEILGNYGEDWEDVMDWAENKAKEVTDDWRTFLSYDLYNLGRLASKINYKE